MGADLIEIGLILSLVVGGAVWGFYTLKGVGRTAQKADDLTKTSTTQNAMLQAGANAPHDPAALDSQLRGGGF
jgi:hypothetical protein